MGGVGNQMLTYRMRLLPSKAQHARLQAALDHTRDLYNAALEERISYYRRTGKTRSYYEQTHALAELRADPAWALYSVSMQRWPLARLDNAYGAFFRRVKSGGLAGFPRFRSGHWFKSFGFADRWGWKFQDGRLKMKGIGAIRVHAHRLMSSAPLSCAVKREGKNWYALLTVTAQRAAKRSAPAVGVDLGLSNLAALSTGEIIQNPRAYVRAQKELRRRQRAAARCSRGSSGRRKARDRAAAAHAKMRRVRDTYLHQVSADLTRRFGLIAVEALNVKGLARSHLAKPVNDAAWAKLVNFIRYKAEKAGAELIEVNPNHTSQTCPDCGVIKAKTLAERIHRCECGCVLDRDVAAAKVILHRGVAVASQLNVAGCGERAGGNLPQDGARRYRREADGG
jgi:putative transposase